MPVWLHEPRRASRATSATATAARSATRARRSCSASAIRMRSVMFIGEAPGQERGPAGRAVRRRGRQAPRRAARACIGLARERRLHRERPQVPAAEQPRPAARRDRDVHAVPARADPADRPGGDRDARQLRDEVRARRPTRGITALRGPPAPGRRAVTVVPDLPSRRGPLRPHQARRAVRGLPAAAARSSTVAGPAQRRRGEVCDRRGEAVTRARRRSARKTATLFDVE